MSFGQIAAASIRLAGEGFAVFPAARRGDRDGAPRVMSAGPSNAAIYLPEGRPPRVGERFVQSDPGEHAAG